MKSLLKPLTAPIQSVLGLAGYQVTAVPTGSRERFHARHHAEAREILHRLEQERGALDSRYRRLADEYARDVLGWSGYAPWLYVYAAVAGEFREGWIPDNYYGEVVMPRIKGPYGEAISLNSLSRIVCGNCGYFPDIAYCVNGGFYSSELEFVAPDRIKDVLFGERDKVVFKVDGSSRGDGVYVIDRAGFSLDAIRRLGSGVFQSYIDQHDEFRQITPGSVATVRMTTVLDDAGKSRLRAGYVRVGRNRDTHVRAESSLRVTIDCETGRFDALGYRPDWSTVDRHPDTQVVFEGRRVPAFGKCVEAVLELQGRMPFSRCIGWDVCVDSTDRVRVMELNARHNGIKFSEATRGPCFTGLGWEKLWQSQ